MKQFAISPITASTTASASSLPYITTLSSFSLFFFSLFLGRISPPHPPSSFFLLLLFSRKLHLIDRNTANKKEREREESFVSLALHQVTPPLYISTTRRTFHLLTYTLRLIICSSPFIFSDIGQQQSRDCTHSMI